jgi:hypothetical protein
MFVSLSEFLLKKHTLWRNTTRHAAVGVDGAHVCGRG